jgi:hypothetical protein
MTPEDKLKKAEALIDKLSIALNDWTHTYAPEFCHEETVKESRDRIGEYGTLGYVAHLLSEIDEFKEIT